VLDAIVQVLIERGEPMRAKDIHAAVEALVGEPVPPPSVKGALAKNVTGSSARFVRVARGRYILPAAIPLIDFQAATERSSTGAVPGERIVCWAGAARGADVPTGVERR
jgi:hypothetical protein